MSPAYAYCICEIRQDYTSVRKHHPALKARVTHTIQNDKQQPVLRQHLSSSYIITAAGWSATGEGNIRLVFFWRALLISSVIKHLENIGMLKDELDYYVLQRIKPQGQMYVFCVKYIRCLKEHVLLIDKHANCAQKNTFFFFKCLHIRGLVQNIQGSHKKYDIKVTAVKHAVSSCSLTMAAVIEARAIWFRTCHHFAKGENQCICIQLLNCSNLFRFLKGLYSTLVHFHVVLCTKNSCISFFTWHLFLPWN